MYRHNKMIYVLMTITSLFWAGAFIAGKLGVTELTPVVLTFFRFLFASIIMIIIMIKYEKKKWTIKKEDWFSVLLLGIVGMAGYQILFFTALKYTQAGNASILAATNPLISAVLAAVFVNERLEIKRIGVLLLALIGVILTISSWDVNVLLNFSFNKGDILMLMAVSCWAIYSVIVKRIMPKYSPIILTTYSFIVCTIALVPFIIKEFVQVNVINISVNGWISILYMAIFPTVIGFLIQQMSIKEIGVSKTAIFLNLVPVFSIILSALILHEKQGYLRLVSGSIIILAVYLNSRIKLKSDT